MLILNFNPFPNLESERLLLRRIDKNDMLEIFAMRSDAENMKYIPRPLVKNHEEALEHLAMIDSGIENNEAINWAITIKGSSKLLGIIGFYRTKHEHYRSEIGYMLLPEIHGCSWKHYLVANLLELCSRGDLDLIRIIYC